MTTTQTTFDSASPEGATLDRATFDGAKAEAFGGRMMSILTGSLLSSMVDIGHRTGLFTAAAESPATSEQLAARAGLCERYVREWLGAVTTGGLVEYDETAGTFFLPPEHAALLTTPAGVGPLATANTVLAGHLHQIVQVFREGGGVPYAAFTPSSPTPWTRWAAGSSTPCWSTATFPSHQGSPRPLRRARGWPT